MEEDDTICVVAKPSNMKQALAYSAMAGPTDKTRDIFIIFTHEFDVSAIDLRSTEGHRQWVPVPGGPIYDFHVALRDVSCGVFPRPLILSTPDFILVPMSTRKKSQILETEPVFPKTVSSKSIKHMQSLISKCGDEHESCRVDHDGTNYVPQRLMDLKSTFPSIRIIDRDDPDPLESKTTHQKSQDRSRYAVLSYRWGNVHGILKLENSTRKHLQEGVNLDKFPRLIQDSIKVARAFDLDYLWVDAFCIIQGDEVDWHTQAHQMAEVYGNSHICFSAAGSVDTLGTLIFERSPHSLGSRNIYLDGREDQSQEFMCIEPRSLVSRLESSGMNDRGWIFQERVLAKRTIHFNTDQLYFECAELQACESHPYGILKDITSPCFMVKSALAAARTKSQSQPNLHDLWHQIVELFSRRRLTNQNDKLMALAGVAHAFSNLFPKQENYVAGHWASALPLTTFWKPLMAFEEQRDPNHPTWSWASYSGAVHFPIENTALQPDYLIRIGRVTSVYLERERRSRYGPVELGILEVVARMVRLHPQKLSFGIGSSGEVVRYPRMRNSTLFCRLDLTWDDGPTAANLLGLSLGTVYLLEHYRTTAEPATKISGYSISEKGEVEDTLEENERNISSSGLILVAGGTHKHTGELRFFNRVGTFSISHIHQYQNAYRIPAGEPLAAWESSLGTFHFAKPTTDYLEALGKDRYRVAII
ncbi:HET-domain-containing protein [Ophiobolus disseminans]|uniref:HET-domain-containing protein n=1 Tax=Ophiobolus disseminans TaxID=1469910 RepID=A0A6A6ZY45_9PLEO|nr:HET-domain-containing protein [Ophiobolus disseminans]